MSVNYPQPETEKPGKTALVLLSAVGALMAVATTGAYKNCASTQAAETETSLPDTDQEAPVQKNSTHPSEKMNREELTAAQIAIQSLLSNSQLTPEEERYVCREYLDIVLKQDPNSNPSGFVMAMDDFQFCASSIDSNSSAPLYDEAAPFYDLRGVLLRCVDENGTLSDEALHRCNQVEVRIFDQVREQLEAEGVVGVTTSYFQEYEFDEQTELWITPGKALRVSNPDASYSSLCQFRTTAEGEFVMNVIPHFSEGGIYDDRIEIKASNVADLVKAFKAELEFAANQ